MLVFVLECLLLYVVVEFLVLECLLLYVVVEFLARNL